MKAFTILLSLLLCMSSISWSQNDAEGCDGQQYFYDLYEDVEKVTVQYGINTGVTGVIEELFMDIYLPTNSQVAQRPAIVWAFGGGFVFGAREDMEEACLTFARKGYVTATIDYRLYHPLLGLPDSTAVLDIMVKAMHDMRAAVRFLRQDADNDNLYRIDPNRIMVGGASAGAITALQTAYLDEEDVIPSYINDVINANGGLEGTSGDAQNLSYSSSAFGVINLSGALLRNAWMDNSSNIPLVSMHGMEDVIVPFNHGVATADINGLIVEFVGMDGSGLIHQKAETLGMNHYLVAVPGGGHDDIYFAPEFEPYRIDYSENGILFVYNQICPDTELGPPPTSTFKLPLSTLEAGPNPTNGLVRISIPENQLEDIFLYDTQGKLVWAEKNINDQVALIHLEGFQAGQYYLLAFDDKEQAYREILIKY